MKDLVPHLLAIATFALLCGGWVLLQRWIRRTEPAVKGPEDRCGDCRCGAGACERSAG